MSYTIKLLDDPIYQIIDRKNNASIMVEREDYRIPFKKLIEIAEKNLCRYSNKDCLRSCDTCVVHPSTNYLDLNEEEDETL